MRKSTRFIVGGIITLACISVIVYGTGSDSDVPPEKASDNSVSSSYCMYVASEGLNVRQEPDAGAVSVFVLQQNDKVFTDKVSHDGWYKIAAKSTEGYVNALYLSDSPLSEEEIAERKAVAAEPQKTSAGSQPAPQTKKADNAVVSGSQQSAESADTTEDVSGSVTPHVTLTKRPKTD